MNTETESKPQKRLPYWAVLLIGVIGTGVVANLLSFLFQIGGFTTWKSLSKPPSQATHIIYADPNAVWVETKDSERFELTVNCYRENCFEWVQTTEDIPDSSAGTILSSGMDCASLSRKVFPISPPRNVIECVKIDEFGVHHGSVTYYAVFADGTLQYWQNGNNSIAAQIFLVVATFILPFLAAVLISVIYLLKRVIHRARASRVIEAG